MAVIWVGAASCWVETVRATWDKNKFLESKQEIVAEPTMCAADIYSVSLWFQHMLYITMLVYWLHFYDFVFANPSWGQSYSSV